MPEAGGTAQLIAYGSSPQITRLDGYGNGNRSLELTAASMKTILTDGYMANPTYDYGAGPINIKVVDPLNLANGYFTCKFRDYTAPNIGNSADTASWVIGDIHSRQKLSSPIHTVHVGSIMVSSWLASKSCSTQPIALFAVTGPQSVSQKNLRWIASDFLRCCF